MLLLVIILLTCSLGLTDCESVCTLPNTGSVLFRNIDVHRKHCWSREELALLYSRRLMMELIPRQIPHNIPLILEFLQICLSTLREVATSEKVYDYMVAALADTFGGYLQTYGLPLMHEAYYEGYVSYDNAAEFHRLHDNFKSILMTNGEGWTKPMEVRKHINRILPLKMPSTVSSKPCSLLLSDATTQKSAVDELSACDNQTNTLIPLPIIDDNKNPNSIAIPFKNHALFNLKSRSSYDVLIKYYIEASRCISKTQQTGLEQSQFDHVFVNWLKNKVITHLRDESWFVGFSNVLRIEETIQQREGMISAGSGKQKEEESLFSELENETQVTTTTYIIIFLILLVSLILICFLYWTFIKNCIMCCGNVDVESTGGSQEDSSDRSSLLSTSDESSGRAKKRPCKHEKNQFDTSNPPSARSGGTDASKLTLSCGLGKGFSRSRNRK